MNIRINTPCSENWTAMKALDRDRFCESCKSKVQDLRNATAEQIMQQYHENNGKMCGRISGKLLNQQYQNEGVRTGYFYQLKVFCWAVVFSFGASLFSIPDANAKGMIKSLKSKMMKIEQDSAQTHLITIKGVVKDKLNKELLPFVNIVAIVNDTQIIAKGTTDLDGKYQLKIDAEKYKKIDIKARYVGYEDVITKDISIKGNKTINIDFETRAYELMGDIIIEGYQPPLVDPFQSGKTVTRDEYNRMPK